MSTHSQVQVAAQPQSPIIENSSSDAEKQLFDNSESFAQGMKNKLRSLSRSEDSNDMEVENSPLLQSSMLNRSSSLIQPTSTATTATTAANVTAELSKKAEKEATSSIIAQAQPNSTKESNNSPKDVPKIVSEDLSGTKATKTHDQPATEPKDSQLPVILTSTVDGPGITQPAAAPSAASATTSTVTNNAAPKKSKRKSFFGFNNSTSSIGSISGPVAIDDTNLDSKLQVPEALREVQKQQKQMNMNRDFIPTRTASPISHATSMGNMNGTSTLHTPLQVPQQTGVQRKPSMSSMFTSTAMNGYGGNNNNRLQKSKNSLKSFFKYKKSVSINNLNGLQSKPSNSDLNSTMRNDTYSVMSMDQNSLISNATTRTSMSSFKKNVFNKLKSRNTSGGSMFNFRKKRDNSDQMSVRTSNTANFNYAINNIAEEDSVNGSPQSPVNRNGKGNGNGNGHANGNGKSYPMEFPETPRTPRTPKLRQETPKKYPPSAISNKTLTPTKVDDFVKSEEIVTEPAAPGDTTVTDDADDIDVLFPKSLDSREVNSIIQLERKLSTRSVKRNESLKHHRASIEVKAKEDGMTVEFGKEVNEPPVGLKKTNSILKRKSIEPDSVIVEEPQDVGKIQESSETQKGRNVTKQTVVMNQNLQPPNAGTGSSSSPKSPMSDDFGINFSDTNLDLDFPEFQLNSNYSNDDVSSRSFESNDEDLDNLQQKAQLQKPALQKPQHSRSKSRSQPMNVAVPFQSSFGTVPKKMAHKVQFSSRIILYETYHAEDYDRHPEIATCNQLTPSLAQQIREELNTFKAEMPIHEQSRCNTHFF